MAEKAKTMTARRLMRRQNIMTVISLAALATSLVALTATIAMRGGSDTDNITAESIQTRSLRIVDDRGFTRATFDYSDPVGSAMLVIYGDDDAATVMTKDSFMMYDPPGKKRASLMVVSMDDVGSSYDSGLTLSGPDGTSRLSLYTELGSSGMALYDRAGQGTIALRVDRNGRPLSTGIR